MLTQAITASFGQRAIAEEIHCTHIGVGLNQDLRSQEGATQYPRCIMDGFRGRVDMETRDSVRAEASVNADGVQQ